LLSALFLLFYYCSFLQPFLFVYFLRTRPTFAGLVLCHDFRRDGGSRRYFDAYGLFALYSCPPLPSHLCYLPSASPSLDLQRTTSFIAAMCHSVWRAYSLSCLSRSYSPCFLPSALHVIKRFISVQFHPSAGMASESLAASLCCAVKHAVSISLIILLSLRHAAGGTFSGGERVSACWNHHLLS